jgi:Amt family ammonium transporter
VEIDCSADGEGAGFPMKKYVIQRLAIFLCLIWFSPVLPVAQAAGGVLPSAPRATIAALIAPDIHVDRLAAVEKAVADAKSAADNSWMLTSSALVLLMTGPGLALFYGGLVRKKNVLSTMMQSFAMMAVITVLWGLVGYSLAFGSGNSFIGGLHNIFLRGVGAQPDPIYAATIPV